MDRRSFIYGSTAALICYGCGRGKFDEFTKGAQPRHVYLTLDEQVQNIARLRILNPLSALIRQKRLPSDTDLAFVCIHNGSGDLLAYLPTCQENSEFDNCRNAVRDIASTAKMFVYAIALQTSAISPDDTFMDEPMSFPRLDGPGTYSPSNYQGKYQRRPLTITDAIAYSSNSIALQVYHKIAQKSVHDYIDALSLPQDFNVNLLPLGRWAMSPLGLASAATIFARGGSRVFPRFIFATASDGERQTETQVKTSPQIFREDVCRIVSQSMWACLARGSGSAASDLAPRVRGKTGTSSDAITVMQSKEVTCVLSIFRRNSTYDLGISGGRLCVPLVAGFYRLLLKARPELLPPWV